MESRRPTLITLLILVTLLPLISQMIHWAPASAQSDVTIDMTWVSKNRTDVVDVTYIGFRMVNTADNSPFLGKLTLKGWPGQWFANVQGWCIIPVYSNEIANLTWTVDNVLFGSNNVTFTQTMPDPSVVFDKVQIELDTRTPRIGIGSEATIQWSGRYIYDDTPFQGRILLNHDNLTSNEVEMRNFTVIEIIDEVYNVTGFESNSVGIIYDRVGFDLILENERIGVGDSPDIALNARYQYDSAQFYGSVVFNDSLTKEQVGRYTYTISSINDVQNDVTVFQSNAVEVIFDQVNLEIDTPDLRLDLEEEPEITWSGEYAYDSEPFIGEVFLNVGSLSIHLPGQYQIYPTGVVDPIYGLESYSSNTLDVTWDRIRIDLEADDRRISVGDEVVVDWTGYYEADGSSFEGDVEVLPLTMRYQVVGETVYEATRIQDPLYGITGYITDPLIIIWDQVSITVSIPFERVMVGTRIEPVITGVYEYDEAPFQGTSDLDEDLVQHEIGEFTFAVASIDDLVHGLTEFESNEASCIWDRIVVEESISAITPGSAGVTLDFSFESDGAPVEGAEVYINGKLAVEEEPGRYTSRVFNLSPSLRVSASLDSPGFDEEYAFGQTYSIGNIAAYLVVVVVIIVVVALRFTNLRERVFRRGD